MKTSGLKSYQEFTLSGVTFNRSGGQWSQNAFILTAFGDIIASAKIPIPTVFNEILAFVEPYLRAILVGGHS